MPDLDRVKPTLPLAKVRALLEAVTDDIVPRMNDAWRRGEVPESRMLALSSAARDVRGAVERSHRARVQAAGRPPGPRLTRVPDVRFDPATGEITDGGAGRPVYVFAKPGEVTDG